MHDPFCPCAGLTHGDTCPPGSGYTKRYAARSIDNGLLFKLRMAFRQQLSTREEWGPVEKKGKPCSSVLVEPCLAFITEEQITEGALLYSS